jgi:hypothetical protein
MTFHDYTVSQHYIVEPEWQATPRVRIGVRRVADSRESHSAPQYDAAALTAALCLNSKPVLSELARKVTGNYAIPYDVLLARFRRRNRIPSE